MNVWFLSVYLFIDIWTIERRRACSATAETFLFYSSENDKNFVLPVRFHFGLLFREKKKLPLECETKSWCFYQITLFEVLVRWVAVLGSKPELKFFRLFTTQNTILEKKCFFVWQQRIALSLHNKYCSTEVSSNIDTLSVAGSVQVGEWDLHLEREKEGEVEEREGPFFAITTHTSTKLWLVNPYRDCVIIGSRRNFVAVCAILVMHPYI